jgi:uncharacterized protein YkwD
MPLEFHGSLPRQRVVTIGSAADNDIIIDHPTVSRHHAVIARPGILRRRKLSDLNSTNGTLVNGHRIKRPVRFRSGDNIRVGAVRVSFDSDSFHSALHRLFVPLTFLCLFLLGFASTEYVLSKRVGPTHLLVSSASVVRKSTESSTNLPENGSGSASANHVGRFGVRAVIAPRALSDSETPTLSTSTVPEWLRRLNDYRRQATLPALTDDSSLDAAEVSHARYLVMNYSDYFKKGSNAGSAMHTEDTSKQGYSDAGLIAAEQSDLYEGCGTLMPQSQAVDGWMEGAFHRLSLLSPGNKLAAYGFYKQPGGCWAAGLRLEPGNGAPGEAVVEFPGDGGQISLTMLVWGEWPNVLTSCPGYVFPAGLPITIQFGYGATPRVRQTSIATNGHGVEHCLIDAASYENPDPKARA